MTKQFSSKLNYTGIIVATLAIAFALLDRFTKWLVITNLTEPINFSSWFSLKFEQNFGVAWSMPIPPTFTIPLNIILLLILIWGGFKYLDMRFSKSKILLALIIGGALGNIYDRVMHGYVIDFIAFSFWPVFNLADIFLSVGVFLLILFYGKIHRTSN